MTRCCSIKLTTVLPWCSSHNKILLSPIQLQIMRGQTCFDITDTTWSISRSFVLRPPSITVTISSCPTFTIYLKKIVEVTLTTLFESIQFMIQTAIISRECSSHLLLLLINVIFTRTISSPPLRLFKHVILVYTIGVRRLCATHICLFTDNRWVDALNTLNYLHERPKNEHSYSYSQ